MTRYAIVGGGILGCALARELLRRSPRAEVTLLEKEAEVGSHQSGHNSGVVHAGLYYTPGSLKARLCRRGVGLLREYARERGLPYDECGKVLIARDAAEQERLEAIAERARANGVPGAQMVGPAGLAEVEPEARGVAALVSPTTAVTDYRAVTAALAADVWAGGGQVRTGCPVERVVPLQRGVRVVTEPAAESAIESATGPVLYDRVIVCAGLQSDRVARRSGGGEEPAIIPFFGQYYGIDVAHSGLTRGLVYPVPDPRYPFLGMHLTRRVSGGLMVGPNAFLAAAREGYEPMSVSAGDLASVAAWPGFWRFAAANMPTAWRELRGVLSPERFLQEASSYVPALADAQLSPLTRGVRAQAMTRGGDLVDDFAIETRGPVTFVRNAPSPGATAALAIAEYLAEERG